MEMIPDQKPPVPRGEGPLAKAIFFGIIALLLGSIALYALYPPLQKAGWIKLRGGEKLVVYRGETIRDGGLTQHISIVEAPASTEPNFLLALAKAHCVEAISESRLLGTRQRIAPAGEMTVRFVKGGRYLYRFYAFDDWQMTYARDSCELAPFLSGDLEDWVLYRGKSFEAGGEQGVRVSFRWKGRGDAPELPMKEVCEMVVANPPHQLRDLINDEIKIVDIVHERGVEIGIVELYSWVGRRYNRVDGLCLEAGSVEVEA